MKTNLTITIFFTLATLFVFSQEKSKDFDYGVVENNKYINTFFNMEMTLPTDWVVQTKVQTEELAETGKELVAGDDTKLKAVMKVSEINSAFLLSVFQYEKGSAVEYNPSISIIAENIKNYPGIKNGSDYLFQTRRLIEQSQFKYDYLDKEFEKEVINGTLFYTMNAGMKYMGLNIRQVYYSTVSNGFSISAIISFTDKKQKKELLKSINSTKLGN